MKYAGALSRIRPSVVRDDDELLRSVARCTALISTRLDNIDAALFVEDESDTANARSGGSAVNSREATTDHDGPTVE